MPTHAHAPAHTHLANAHGRAPARVPQVAADIALGVVGREGLLVAGLEDGDAAARLVEAQVAAAHALLDALRLLARLQQGAGE